MTWNCEGFKRVSNDLLSIIKDFVPDFIFISEPWLFQSDLPIATCFFSQNYCCSLNSDDKLDPEVALTTTHAHGGVLVFWKSSLDQFVTTVSVPSSRILPIIFNHPNHPKTIQIAVYLPTSGHESEFVQELSLLETIIDQLASKHPSVSIYIRGDANSSLKLRPGNKRDPLFKYFCERLSFISSSINHPTYHHFTGNISSSIDVVLQRSSLPSIPQEKILKVICSKTSPLVDSKHDVIVSSFSLPFTPFPTPTTDKAPSIPNDKHRIIWSDPGVEHYRELLGPTLLSLMEDWKNPTSSVSFSVLLQCTNKALTRAAKASNDVIDLTKPPKPKKVFTPAEISLAATQKNEAHKSWVRLSEIPQASEHSIAEARLHFVTCRTKVRRLWRRHQSSLAIAQNDTVFTVTSADPRRGYHALRSQKSTSSGKISELKVKNTIFHGEDVADGFYHNIKSLKTLDSETKNCKDCKAFKFDYELIKIISESGEKIPPISLHKAEELLHSLKPHVCDHYNVSALHFINGGPLAVQMFQFLVNSAIENLENTTCEEMNTAHASVLYKGHSKDKTQASSYRTISNCPFLSKAMDFYIRELSITDWSEAQPDTQFLGPNKSHELGALLLTETIHHSIKDLNKPVFGLFLDARSAFDLTIREITMRKLHFIGTSGQRLLYLDNRLKSRKTYVEWDKKVLGPISDERGFEQGGISSGDLYTIYNADQLSAAQDSGLGVNLGVAEVSSIGQADDVVLLSTDLSLLHHLLQLTLDYCSTHHVTLAPEKTKLMVFSSPHQNLLVEYQKAVSPISINNKPIEFVSNTEHVGIIRSIHGNLPHIQNRVTAHMKALYSLLPSGLALNLSLNPAASLRIQSLYANPVLFSGVAALTLNKSEMSILHTNHKNVIQSLQKLHKKTPECFTLFLGGSLGATATTHLRQLALFGMICRLPENILNAIAKDKLYSEPDSSSSWFVQIRHLCTQYSLPSPLFLLYNPPPKSSFKTLAKKRIVDYWQEHYRSEAHSLPSLKYFKPQFMSLLKPHPLWTTCKGNSYEVNKSVTVARLLSGRY